MNLEEFRFLAGGEVDEGALPGAITLEQYRLFSGWLESLQQQWLDPFTEGAQCSNVVLVLSRSPSMVCRVRLLDDGSAGLVVPLGVLVRTTVLARLLLESFDQADEPSIHVVASVQDERAESDWEIAPRLVPLFGECSDDNDHWLALASLGVSSPPSPRVEQSANDIVWACIVYLIWHEVAHIARQHFTLLDHARRNPDLRRDGVDDAAVRRALEFDADLVAAQLLLSTALEELEATDDATRDTGFQWMGYAVAMVFALYDTRRKALSLYSDAYYPHPLVRRQLFSDVAATYIANNRADLVDTWRAHERAGWSACVKALRHMDVDTMTGRFGGTADARSRFTPVTALTYTYFDSMFMREWADEEVAHAEEIFGLVQQ
jgi:hypothetical protein